MISIFKKLLQQTKQFYNFIIFSIQKKTSIDYFLFATSIGVLILLFIPTTFWLIFANIYLIFLNGFYNHIVKSNKFIQITIVLWLLSLILYALTLFITFDETYINMVVFAIRRFVFLLIFIITLITGLDLPAVQNFQADYATFNEGPSNKSAFLTFIRKYHILIIFSSFISLLYFSNFSFCNKSIYFYFFWNLNFGFCSTVFGSVYTIFNSFLEKATR